MTSHLHTLGKYRQAHKLADEGQLKESAALFTDLVGSQLAPRSFWPVLFSDVVALMEKADKVRGTLSLGVWGYHSSEGEIITVWFGLLRLLPVGAPDITLIMFCETRESREQVEVLRSHTMLTSAWQTNV